MTTEEKAKAYDELFVKASRIYNKGNDVLIMHTIEVLFPELKENEDERIRKALIKGFNKLDKSAVWYNGITNAQILDWIEKKGQKPQEEKVYNADKVEPNVESKFKADDFILNGDVTDDGKPEIFKVLNVRDTWYAVENVYDGRNTIITFKQDSSCRLWDLTKDAKDGDFLVCGGDPFIFKRFDRFHPGCPVAYCGISCDGIFQVSTGDGWWTDEEVFPANKEQCEQLEKAISDAGYIWDAESRQLKEINYHCTGVGKKEETGTLKEMLQQKPIDIVAIMKDYFANTPKEQQEKDWAELKHLNDIGPNIEIPFGANDSELQEWSYSIPEGFRAEIEGDKVVIKKGEQKPTDEEMKELLRTEHEKGRADVLTEMQKSVAWNKEDDNCLSTIIAEFSKCAGKSVSKDEWMRCNDFLNSLKERIQPQTKQEWSGEDERFLNIAINILNSSKVYTKSPDKYEDTINWLKSLKDRVQPKQEWSGEDDYNLQCCIAKIQYDIDNGRIGRNRELLTWIKFLKYRVQSQSQWKPSDEQIIALRWVLNNIPYNKHKEEISGLFDQIKEL